MNNQNQAGQQLRRCMIHRNLGNGGHEHLQIVQNLEGQIVAMKISKVVVNKALLPPQLKFPAANRPALCSPIGFLLPTLRPPQSLQPRSLAVLDARPTPSLKPSGACDEMLKKYKFRKTLGSGAFGTVYLIENQKGEKYAMKIIAKVVNGYSSEEANVMKRLNHPNLTRLYDVCENSKYMNLVMDFMEGGNLQDRIRQKKSLSNKESCLYFLQMCEAIQYLHGKNVTHRDLKPDNILLASKSSATLLKISDFGLSKNHMEYYLTTQCGTRYFMAPEYFIGEANRFTSKVDIWSLGVILYNCLTGEYPFSSPHDAVRKQCSFHQSVWQTSKREAIEIIKQMLTKNVNQRPDISIVSQSSWLNDFQIKSVYRQLLEEK